MGRKSKAQIAEEARLEELRYLYAIAEPNAEIVYNTREFPLLQGADAPIEESKKSPCVEKRELKAVEQTRLPAKAPKKPRKPRAKKKVKRDDIVEDIDSPEFKMFLLRTVGLADFRAFYDERERERQDADNREKQCTSAYAPDLRDEANIEIASAELTNYAEPISDERAELGEEVESREQEPLADDRLDDEEVVAEQEISIDVTSPTPDESDENKSEESVNAVEDETNRSEERVNTDKTSEDKRKQSVKRVKRVHEKAPNAESATELERERYIPGAIASASRDEALDVEELEALASAGNADAAYQLGRAYEEGRGVARNCELAVEFYESAAYGGSAAAQLALALCYLWASGVRGNKRLAYQWFRRAAKQGEPTALYQLGLCYSVGIGVDVDLTKAAKCFRRAAKLNNAPAQYAYAMALRYGHGVRVDRKLARKWFECAAENGVVAAERELRGNS